MGSASIEHHSANSLQDGLEARAGNLLLNGHSDSTYRKRSLRYNDPAKPWVVQKFGGTSVGKAPHVIARQIVKQWLDTHRVVCVFSARSGQTKLAGTTNRLLRTAKEAANRHTKAYHNLLQDIRIEHIAQARAHILSVEIQNQVHDRIAEECEKLARFLSAIEEIGECSTKSLDTIIGKGELLACHLMSGILEDQGIGACCVDLSDVTEGNTEDATFYRSLTDAFVEKVRACGDKVPVLTGYFGRVTGGLLNKIGRGYTDLCSAMVAIGLHAEELQIWKEVDGIFSANPSKVCGAKLLAAISPSEASELTFYGSEVIHPFTMEQIIKANIPIRIRNVMNLKNPGTLISPEPYDRPSLRQWSPTFFRKRGSSTPTSNGKPPRPIALTVKNNILVLNVHSNKRSLSHGFFAGIFSILDKWRLSVDLISTSEVSVSMAIHSGSALVSGGSDDEEKEITDTSLRGTVDEIAQFASVNIKPNMAIISLVGKEMKMMKGIAGKMFSVLGENDINIEMISQGASEINISCVIEDSAGDRAINILHTNIFTFFD